MTEYLKPAIFSTKVSTKTATKPVHKPIKNITNQRANCFREMNLKTDERRKSLSFELRRKLKFEKYYFVTSRPTFLFDECLFISIRLNALS